MAYIYHTTCNRRIGPDFETRQQAEDLLRRMSSQISTHNLAISDRRVEPELVVVKP